MSLSSNSLSQKEYLKKYLSEDVKKKKKKKVTKGTSALKRSKIIDDDIDLNSMRPLDDDELELYQMDEDAPLIAGIIDERPAEVKAQEYYNPKRWKVFGGDDGVNVVDSMDKNQPNLAGKLDPVEKDLEVNQRETLKEKMPNRSESSDSDNSPVRNKTKNVDPLRRQESQNKTTYKSNHPETEKKRQSSHHDNSDLSPSMSDRKSKGKYNSDPSPPRRDQSKKYSQDQSDSDASLSKRKSKQKMDKHDQSPRRKDQKREKHRSDSDNSPQRKEKGNRSHERHSDNSPPRKNKESLYRHNSDSDNSPPRVKKRTERSGRPHDKYKSSNNEPAARIRKKSSDSDNSPPRKDRKSSPYSRKNHSPSRIKRERLSRSNTPPIKPVPSYLPLSGKSNRNNSPRLSRKDLMYEKNVKRHFSDSDDSPPRRRKNSFRYNESSSNLSTPRKTNEKKSQKKKLYKPNDSSSSEDGSRSKSKKMKTTLDGKQAGLQDAKQLRKELSDLKMKEDFMFSKMDASVSGVGAAAIKRDRKTGQIRDMEKEKEIQKEKDAKTSVVNEKYSKWGKGLKQVEDAKERAAEALKEMSKPLARYADDEDLDKFLKAQEREGDPMLDFIRQNQKEATPLTGEKPTYRGSYNPNRFGIRPGHRWDGVVRSSGYEKEWFTHQNARKARDEEAYKWSTSDM